MATLRELREEVIQHQFSPNQYNAYADDRLSHAQRYICAQTDFMEIEEAITMDFPAGTATVALPDDFHRIEHLNRVDNDKWVPLTKLSNADYDSRERTSGTPLGYKIQNNFLTLWPRPESDEQVVLTYYQVPPALVNDIDQPVIPEQYQYLMVHFALKHCYERENDYTSAQYHWGQFNEGIMKCRGEVHNATNDYSQPRIIGDDGPGQALLVEGF